METVIADDSGAGHDLASWMRARGKERWERIWFRDTGTADARLAATELPGELSRHPSQCAIQ
jgi:hypothetical protein